MGGHPSRPAVAGRLERSTRRLGRAALERLRRTTSWRSSPSSLLDLAPGGVYRATPVTRCAVVSYTTVSPLPVRALAVCSLWHCPAGRPGSLLATTLPCGARTFLGGRVSPADATAQPTRPSCAHPSDPHDRAGISSPECPTVRAMTAPGSTDPSPAGHRSRLRRARSPSSWFRTALVAAGLPQVGYLLFVAVMLLWPVLASSGWPSTASGAARPRTGGSPRGGARPPSSSTCRQLDVPARRQGCPTGSRGTAGARRATRPPSPPAR